MKSLFLTGILALSTSCLAAEEKVQTPKTSVTTAQKDITPPAIPSTKTHNSFFFTSDFIYWTAHEDGLVIGITGTGDVNKILSNKGKVL